MTDREDKARARAESQAFQEEITRGWREISVKYPAVIEDFLKYIDTTAQLYRYIAEEQAIGSEKIDDHEVAQYLQRAKVCDTVKTYITSRIDQDVAQPIKKSK